VDTGNRRISLGMKQIEPNPWDILAEKYPVGSKIKGVVKNTTDFGAFIGVPEGVDGLIHVSDVSWENKAIDPNTFFKKGEEIECMVLSIDKAAEKFSLGIKQMTENPWKSVFDKYPVGTKVKGKVTKATDFGLFIEVEQGVEGLLHISELEGDRDAKPKDKLKAYPEGTEIECMVTQVDLKDHKLSLSIKALSRAEERENIKAYSKQTSSSAKSSLGDIMRDALAGKKDEGNKE